MKSTDSLLAVVDFALAVMALVLVGCSDNPIGPELGTVVVEVATSGPAFDPDGFVVDLDDGAQTEDVDVSDSVTLEVEAGDHTVELTDIAWNCMVDGDNPVSVTVTAGETSTASFAVTCVLT